MTRISAPPLRRLIPLLLLSILIVYMHTNGIERGWYWEYPWLDLLMHFWGGVIVGLLVLWGSERVWGVRLSLAAVVLAALFVGIAWEVFEYALGLIEVPRDVYIKDTAIDLILDTLGGALVALYRLSHGSER